MSVQDLESLSENTPLIIKKEIVSDDSDNEMDNNEKSIKFVQKLRAESNLKWIILFCNCVAWFSTWCVITNLSTVEDSVIKQYGMTDIQFSAMFTVVYATAVMEN